MDALNHYYEQNGDLIADPDMVVRIDTNAETVEALTFQDTYTYREACLDGNRVDVKAKKELNEFLLQWLTNLTDQGHRLGPVLNGDAKPLDCGGLVRSLAAVGGAHGLEYRHALGGVVDPIEHKAMGNGWLALRFMVVQSRLFPLALQEA